MEALKSWFKTTTLGMYINNRRNGFRVISEREYNRIVSKQKTRTIIFI